MIIIKLEYCNELNSICVIIFFHFHSYTKLNKKKIIFIFHPFSFTVNSLISQKYELRIKTELNVSSQTKTPSLRSLLLLYSRGWGIEKLSWVDERFQFTELPHFSASLWNRKKNLDSERQPVCFRHFQFRSNIHWLTNDMLTLHLLKVAGGQLCWYMWLWTV